MPLISHFYGILIYLHREMGERHHIPHFHAKYAEYESIYDFDGNCIRGELPPKQCKLIIAWCALHVDELNAAWEAWQESGETIKIDGLK